MSSRDHNSIRRFSNGQDITTLILAAVLLVTILCPLPPLSTTLHRTIAYVSKTSFAASQLRSDYWTGWTGIKHMVVFGDSISTTRFNIDGEQPSRSNPLGNPDFPGQTSVELDEPNWIGYLTASYNASFIKTVSLASGGATVDTDIISGMAPFVKSFKDHIEQWWLPHYAGPTAKSDFDWRADDTLFLSFLGTVDVHRAFLDAQPDEQVKLLERDVDRYRDLLDTLYDHGARNFLVMSTLPLERAPFADTVDEDEVSELRELVREFNMNLEHMAAQFRRDHLRATVFLFDTYALLSQLMDDPCSMRETCGLKDTTSYCKEYMRDGNDDQCEFSIDQYFWLNTLHPSSAVHEALAKAVADYLDRDS